MSVETSSQSVEISKTFTLQAAHRLPHVPEGHKCFGMHGHNFKVKVWFAGPLSPEFGWIADFDFLQRVWNEQVHAVLDHRTLNDAISNPTSELICGWIYTKLQDHLSHGKSGVAVVEVEVSENPGCSARLRIERARPGGQTDYGGRRA